MLIREREREKSCARREYIVLRYDVDTNDKWSNTIIGHNIMCVRCATRIKNRPPETAPWRYKDARALLLQQRVCRHVVHTHIVII